MLVLYVFRVLFLVMYWTGIHW